MSTPLQAGCGTNAETPHPEKTLRTKSALVHQKGEEEEQEYLDGCFREAGIARESNRIESLGAREEGGGGGRETASGADRQQTVDEGQRNTAFIARVWTG
jgi:hypothetical protein